MHGLSFLATTLFLATLTLWIPAYWPVALFEISRFPDCRHCACLRKNASEWDLLSVFALSSIVVRDVSKWLPAGPSTALPPSAQRSVAELGRCLLRRDFSAEIGRPGQKVSHGYRLVRLCLCGRGDPAGISVARQSIWFISDRLSRVRNGPIVYHTHFAVFIEAILPIALFLTLSEAGRSRAFLLVSAVLLTAVLVSASRGGLGLFAPRCSPYWCFRTCRNAELGAGSV